MLGRYQRALLTHYAANLGQPDGLPTSGRFLYYEGEQAGAWPKHYDTKKRRVDQDVSDALTKLRELRIIPWGDISDETRTLRSWLYAATVLEFLRKIGVPAARINPWGAQHPPLVLCESRSLAGVLDVLLRKYLAPVAATNGQAAGFLHTEIIPLLEAGPRRILYLGDFDWQGGQIEQNTQRVLADAHDGVWERIALTQAQVDQYTLPVIQKTDHRYRPPRVHDAVETEALSQAVIVGLVRAALDALLPEPLAAVQVREEEQREDALQRLAEE
jgi:hypothetical protein